MLSFTNTVQLLFLYDRLMCNFCLILNFCPIIIYFLNHHQKLLVLLLYDLRQQYFFNIYFFIMYSAFFLSSSMYDPAPDNGAISQCRWLWATMWFFCTWTQELLKSSQCSLPLSHLSRPLKVQYYSLQINFFKYLHNFLWADDIQRFSNRNWMNL